RFDCLKVFGNWDPRGVRMSSPRKLAHDLFFYGLPRLKAEGCDFAVRSLKTKILRRTPSKKPARFAGERLTLEAMRGVFAHSLISLGITQSDGQLGDPKAVIWGRGRDFEVPMCGGFYLVQRAPEQDLHFELGKEIETWSTTDELFDKVDFYLKHPMK